MKLRNLFGLRRLTPQKQHAPGACAAAPPADCGDETPPARFRILMTNMQLTEGTGTEQVTRDLARHLLRRGHDVAVYSPNQAAFAARMRAEGVCVVNSPEAIGWSPDVIHGHHFLETMAAVLVHPQARALFVCHDGRQWTDHPPFHPRVLRYVAVDNNCRERLAPLVAAERLHLIGNWFDSERFRARPPLPKRPQRAVFFSNYAGQDQELLRVVREACQAEDLELELLGNSAGNQRSDPEAVLGGYDLVFAKGKCAIEALATGCSVIICHERPGPLVTTLNMEFCRRWNFGLRLATLPTEVDVVRREICRYQATDAASVSMYVRRRCGLAGAVSAYERLYEEIMAEPLPAAVDGQAKSIELFLAGGAGACPPLSPDQMRRIRVWPVGRPKSLVTGAVHELFVHVRNDSDVGVSSSVPAPVHVSFQWELDGVRGSHDWASPRTPLPTVIPPGAGVDLSVRVVAPMQAGKHRLRLTLVQEGVAWFDLVDPKTACCLTVHVAPCSPPSGVTMDDR